jgi:hypothetical protein
MSRYRIDDEPRPGKLARLTVNPFWPFLGLMLGGAWLGWPWFVLNGAAMGSASFKREAGLVLVAFLLTLPLFIALIAVAQSFGLPREYLRLVLLPVVAFKLAVTYFVFLAQSRSFELFSYFGGVTRNGMYVAAAGFLLRSAVLDPFSGTIFIALLA